MLAAWRGVEQALRCTLHEGIERGQAFEGHIVASDLEMTCDQLVDIERLHHEDRGQLVGTFIGGMKDRHDRALARRFSTQLSIGEDRRKLAIAEGGFRPEAVFPARAP